MPEIFLSYCREDQAIARRFAEGLQREGFRVWWDQALNAGESFDQVTERALKEAKAVVVLWTRRSVQSRWVRSEATLAHRYGTLVPAMLEPCDRPIMFELTHTADLTGWNGKADDPRWNSLIAGLHRLAEGSAPGLGVPATAPVRLPRVSQRWAAIAVAVVVAAALGWWLLRDSGGGTTASASVSPAPDIGEAIGQLGMSRLTDFEGVEEQAAISPDGTLVAFISDRDGQKDVWITRIGTNEFRNLTQGQHLPQYSQETRVLGFAPDGSQVQFIGRNRPEAREFNAWSVPVMGGAVRPLQDGAVEFAWSPDGKSLAYHTSDPGDPLYVREQPRDVDQQLFEGAPGVHNHFPTWTPDGAYVYFTHGTEPRESMEIWRIAAAGGKAEQMTSPPARTVFPVFLDTRTLAFLAEKSQGDGLTLQLLDVESRKVRTVRAGVERFTSLAGSRSGRRLVASVSTQRSSLWRIPLGGGAVATQAERIRLSARGSASPRRLGNELLYLSSSEEGRGIWRIEAASDSEIWNPERGSVAGGLAPEPGGRRIAFPVLSDGATRLYVGNADGTGMHVLARELSVRGSPAWSPDGKWIAIAAESPDGLRLYKIPLDGGEPVQLTKHLGLDPTWSPQGGFIVYKGDQVGPNFTLAAVTATGEPYEIPTITLPRESKRTAFLPGRDADAQLIVLKGDLQVVDFWLIEMATGKQRRLTDLGTEYRLNDFDLAPDGREIILDRVREDADVVMIDLK